MIRKVAVWMFALAAIARGQISQQAECKRIVEANIESTRIQKPEVFATLKTYMFEWSKSSDACVMVIQYKTQDKGKPAVQIVAMNAVTMQLMEGYDHIYLIPAENTDEIMRATTSLFNRYAH